MSRTSCRRRCLRQSLGVKLNTKTTRWIGSWSRRDQIRCVRVLTGGVCREKASKGVEKSCRAKRRRTRGKRRGCKRSRGRHPRSSAPPSEPKSKEVSNRSINRHCSVLDYWDGREKQFRQLLSQSGTVRQWCETPHLFVGGVSYNRESDFFIKWHRRWACLARSMKKSLKGLAPSGSEFAFEGYLSKHFQMEAVTGDSLAVLTLQGWLKDHQRRTSDLDRGSRPSVALKRSNARKRGRKERASVAESPAQPPRAPRVPQRPIFVENPYTRGERNFPR